MGTLDVSSPLPLKEIEDVLAWVDGYKLSRPTKKLHRDFSDAVLMAEILQIHYPKLVETHNYPPRNATGLKLNNWITLNRKVLKKLKLGLCMRTIEQLANSTPGIIDRVLVMAREKIKHDEEETKRNSFEEQNESSGGSYYEAIGDDENVLVVPVKTRVNGVLEIIQQKVVSYDLYNCTKEELKDAKEAITTLKQKVEHVEGMLKLKDERIHELQTQLDRKVLRQKEMLRSNFLQSPEDLRTKNPLDVYMDDFDQRVNISPKQNEPKCVHEDQNNIDLKSNAEIDALAARLNIIKARSQNNSIQDSEPKDTTQEFFSKSGRSSMTKIPLRTESQRHSCHELSNFSPKPSPSLTLKRSISRTSNQKSNEGSCSSSIGKQSSERIVCHNDLKKSLNKLPPVKPYCDRDEVRELTKTFLADLPIRNNPIDASFVLIKSEIIPSKKDSLVVNSVPESIYDSTSAKSILGDYTEDSLERTSNEDFLVDDSALSEGKDDDDFKDTLDDEDITINLAVDKEAHEIARESERYLSGDH